MRPVTPVAFPDDTLLRERGFKIQYRPQKGEPVWSRDGRLYNESKAIKMVRAERLEQLKKLEEAFTQ